MSKTLLLAALASVLTACTITINGSGSEGNSPGQNTSEGPGYTSGDDPPATTTGDAPTSEPPGTTNVPTTETPTTDPTTGEPSTSEPALTGSTGSTGGTGSTGLTGTDTGDTTDTGTESSGTGETTTATTGGGGGYGMCGWNVAKTYYACPTDGGVPGLADPKNNYPIDCRDQELKGGLPCGDVGFAGCCTPTGDLFYCGDNEMMVEENCGA